MGGMLSLCRRAKLMRALRLWKIQEISRNVIHVHGCSMHTIALVAGSLWEMSDNSTQPPPMVSYLAGAMPKASSTGLAERQSLQGQALVVSCKFQVFMFVVRRRHPGDRYSRQLRLQPGSNRRYQDLPSGSADESIESS